VQNKEAWNACAGIQSSSVREVVRELFYHLPGHMGVSDFKLSGDLTAFFNPETSKEKAIASAKESKLRNEELIDARLKRIADQYNEAKQNHDTACDRAQTDFNSFTKDLNPNDLKYQKKAESLKNIKAAAKTKLDKAKIAHDTEVESANRKKEKYKEDYTAEKLRLEREFVEQEKAPNVKFAKDLADTLVSIWLWHNKISSKEKIKGFGTLKKEAIIKALADTVYPGYDVVMLSLLAALWIHCQDDRPALLTYYQQIKDTLNEAHVEAFNIPDNWKTDIFDKKTLLDNVPNAVDIKNAKNFEKIAYFYLTPVGRPSDITMSTQTKIPGNNGVFSDCAETMVRGFINHIIYDNGFRPDLLKQQPNEKLVKFYTDTPINADPNSAWADVISDIPFVSYSQIVGRVNKFPPPGCIKLQSTLEGENRATLKEALEHTYTVVENDKGALYELVPSCRNLIIVLNHLLNLGLFGENNANLPSEMIEPDFVKTYLPEVFKQFGELQETGKELQDLQDNDYGDFSVLLNKPKQYMVTFKISQNGAHGEFFHQALTDSGIKIIDTLAKEDLLKLPISASFLLSENRFKVLLGEGYNQLLAFFAQKIDDPVVGTTFLDSLPTVDVPIFRLLNCVFGSRITENSSARRALYFKAAQDKEALVYNEAMQEARYLPLDNDSIEILSLFIDNYKRPEEELLNLLLEKRNKAIDESIAKAQQNMGKRPLLALRSFVFLATKGYGLAQAALCAKTSIEKKDRPTVLDYLTLTLWKLLLEKNEELPGIINDAIATAKKIMDKQPSIALRLFLLLVKKGPGYGLTEATVAAKTLITKANDLFRRFDDLTLDDLALDLWKTLLEKKDQLPNIINDATATAQENAALKPEFSRKLLSLIPPKTM